jgi:hypothetical protein
LLAVAGRPNSDAHSHRRTVTRAQPAPAPFDGRAQLRGPGRRHGAPRPTCASERPGRGMHSTQQQPGYVGAPATVPALRASCSHLSSQRGEEPPPRGRRVSVVEGLMILAPTGGKIRVQERRCRRRHRRWERNPTTCRTRRAHGRFAARARRWRQQRAGAMACGCVRMYSVTRDFGRPSGERNPPPKSTWILLAGAPPTTALQVRGTGLLSEAKTTCGTKAERT